MFPVVLMFVLSTFLRVFNILLGLSQKKTIKIRITVAIALLCVLGFHIVYCISLFGDVIVVVWSPFDSIHQP